jgi:hypothetical protein
MMGRLKMKTHRSRKKISKSKILGMPDVREHSQAISEFGLKKGGKSFGQMSIEGVPVRLLSNRMKQSEKTHYSEPI